MSGGIARKLATEGGSELLVSTPTLLDRGGAKCRDQGIAGLQGQPPTEISSAAWRRFYMFPALVLFGTTALASPALAGDGSSQLSLPFATGETWSVLPSLGPPTPAAGLHTAGFQNSGSALSSLDFNPVGGGVGQVRAAGDGVIRWAGCSAGHIVFIDHGNGWETSYYHITNEQFANGQAVHRGDWIGNTGGALPCKGKAVGNHVHFTLWHFSGVYAFNHAAASLAGVDIGGRNIVYGASPPSTCFRRLSDAQTACVTPGHSASLYNDGAIGSGAAPSPGCTACSVRAWGDNGYSQFGNGTQTNSTVPVSVPGLTGVTAIAGGFVNGYALKSDGTVWAWGDNRNGQLGSGTQTNSTVPVRVSGLTGVTAIAAGSGSGYALLSNGTVWAWGDNSEGELGNGTQTNSTVPVRVSGLTGVTAIAAGTNNGHALRSDGTVWAWGWNGSGTATTETVPVRVSGLTGVTAIAAGASTGYALLSNGTVSAWGTNEWGEIGNGTTTNSVVPVAVTGLSRVTAIAGGTVDGYALLADGTVWAWGINKYGELGNGTTTNSAVPVRVSGLTGVTAISGGGESAFAIRSGGTVWGWGINASGQLGNRSTTNSAVPVQVSGLTGVTAIAGGELTGYALVGP